MRNRKNFLALGVIIAFLFLIIFFYRLNTANDIDSFDPDVTLYNSSDYVVLKDPDELLSNNIMTPNYKIVFSRVMREYAEREYEEYNEDSIIGFLFKRVEVLDSGKIKSIGRFGQSSEDEIFYVTVLNYEIITFEYTKNNQIVFDENIEINKKINQFIGSLPREFQNYTIDYSKDDDTFLVTFNSSAYSQSEVEKLLVSSTGINSIQDINVSYLGRAGMPSPWW